MSQISCKPQSGSYVALGNCKPTWTKLYGTKMVRIRNKDTICPHWSHHTEVHPLGETNQMCVCTCAHVHCVHRCVSVCEPAVLSILELIPSCSSSTSFSIGTPVLQISQWIEVTCNNMVIIASKCLLFSITVLKTSLSGVFGGGLTRIPLCCLSHK